MQVLRVVLVLITIGCIVGPVGAVVLMYRNNLPQMVITPQISQLLHFGSNNNSNNNNNDNNQNNNNNNNNQNNNNLNTNNPNNPNNNNQNNNNDNTNSNSGNVNNNNPFVNNPTGSFEGSNQYDVTIPNNGNQISDTMTANANCMVEQNGNDNIQLTLDVTPTNVPNDLQSVFNVNNDYAFNFLGPYNGTQITGQNGNVVFEVNAAGSFNPGNPFNITLNGNIDSTQNTLTITLTPGSDNQIGITTSQAIILNSNSNNNNSNNNSNNNNNSSSNNNNSSNDLNPTYTGGQINTSKKTITLTFSISNPDSQDNTLNAMTGTLEITTNQDPIGTLSLNSPVTINPGQTVTVTISGALTQAGQNNLATNYNGITSLDVTIANGAMTINGVTNSQSSTMDLGNINITS